MTQSDAHREKRDLIAKWLCDLFEPDDSVPYAKYWKLSQDLISYLKANGCEVRMAYALPDVNKTDGGYERLPHPGDRVAILVGGPHENLGRIATVSDIQDDGDVRVYFDDQDEDEWIYSPSELRKLSQKG